MNKVISFSICIIFVSCTYTGYSGDDYDDYECYDYECLDYDLNKPMDLSAAYIPGDSILLEWTDVSVNETGYLVKRINVLDTLYGDSVRSYTFSNDSLFTSTISVKTFFESDYEIREGPEELIELDFQPHLFKVELVQSADINNELSGEVKLTWNDPYNLGSKFKITKIRNFDLADSMIFTRSDRTTTDEIFTGQYRYIFQAFNSKDESKLLHDSVISTGWHNFSSFNIDYTSMGGKIAGGNVLVAGHQEYEGNGYQIYNKESGWTSFHLNEIDFSMGNFIQLPNEKLLIRSTYPGYAIFDVASGTSERNNITDGSQLMEIKLSEINGKVLISGIEPESGKIVLEMYDISTGNYEILDEGIQTEEVFSYISENINEMNHVFIFFMDGKATAYNFNPGSKNLIKRAEFDSFYYDTFGWSTKLYNNKILIHQIDSGEGIPIYDPVTADLSAISGINAEHAFSFQSLQDSSLIALTGNDRYVQFVELYNFETDEWLIIDDLLEAKIELFDFPFPKEFYFEHLQEDYYLFAGAGGKSAEWKFHH